MTQDVCAQIQLSVTGWLIPGSINVYSLTHSQMVVAQTSLSRDPPIIPRHVSSLPADPKKQVTAYFCSKERGVHRKPL